MQHKWPDMSNCPVIIQSLKLKFTKFSFMLYKFPKGAGVNVQQAKLLPCMQLSRVQFSTSSLVPKVS